MAAARPDAFLPDLAMSLHNQSGVLSDLGRRENALATIEEAIRLILPLLGRTPYVLPDSGLQLLQNYLKVCDGLEQEPDEELVERMYTILVSAGIVAPDDD